MRLLPGCLILAAALGVCRAETPDIYKRVGHVFWVVRSIDAPLRGWSSLGLADIHDFEKVSFRGEYHGLPVTGHARMAWGHLGGLSVDMMEAPGGDNAFRSFLKSHGDGIFSVVYEVADHEAMNREVARLDALGVRVLQRILIDTDRGSAVFTFFNTEPRGKYVLGLVLWPGGAAPASGVAPVVSHIAFVIREYQSVSDYWKQLGFPAMTIGHASPREDSRYHGQPLLLPFDVGWHKNATPTFEWIIPPSDPANCYADHLKVHGEGVHHLGLPVDNLEKAIASYKELGYGAVQSGAWGDVGKKGSGQYSYMGTDAIGGVVAELIHAYN